MMNQPKMAISRSKHVQWVVHPHKTVLMPIHLHLSKMCHTVCHPMKNIQVVPCYGEMVLIFRTNSVYPQMLPEKKYCCSMFIGLPTIVTMMDTKNTLQHIQHPPHRKEIGILVFPTVVPSKGCTYM